METAVQRHNQTQLFMETPYRNNQMLDDVIKNCLPDTHLCIAMNITAPDEWIKTQTLKQWSNTKPDLHKKPVMFVMGK
jgi:16S rRNA (cytidine1402-2'-O)-methyltransferase